MFAVGRLTLFIVENPFLVLSQLLPLRPARTDRRWRTNLTTQGHTRRRSSLNLHIVRLAPPKLHSPRPLPPPASRALFLRCSVHCNAHDSTPLLICKLDHQCELSELKMALISPPRRPKYIKARNTKVIMCDRAPPSRPFALSVYFHMSLIGTITNNPKGIITNNVNTMRSNQNKICFRNHCGSLPSALACKKDARR